MVASAVKSLGHCCSCCGQPRSRMQSVGKATLKALVTVAIAVMCIRHGCSCCQKPRSLTPPPPTNVWTTFKINPKPLTNFVVDIGVGVHCTCSWVFYCSPAKNIVKNPPLLELATPLDVKPFYQPACQGRHLRGAEGAVAPPSPKKKKKETKKENKKKKRKKKRKKREL